MSPPRSSIAYCTTPPAYRLKEKLKAGLVRAEETEEKMMHVRQEDK